MNALIDILVFGIVVAIVWITALEVRFHSLKNIAQESQVLAEEAFAAAREKVENVAGKRTKKP